MKAKKLVGLALPLMLLGGCITIETGGKKAEPKKEETSKEETKKSETHSSEKGKDDNLSENKKEDDVSSKSNSSSSSKPNSSSSSKSSGVPSAEASAYASKILASASKLSKDMSTVESIASSDVKSIAQKKSELDLLITGARAETKKMKDIQPPAEFKEDHQKIVKAMDLYDEAFKLMVEALREENESKMNKALDKIGEGAKYWEEATKNIGNKQDKMADVNSTKL